ncbi:MAG: hypothetical protein PHW73_00710 [Atribacterota bacterium]|nr:hypothetical protein [Atribacterota bacterium]
MKVKIINANEAANLIEDNKTIAVSGSGSIVPDDILLAIKKRFLETNKPKDLTLMIHMSFGGNIGEGIDVFSQKGLLKRIISSSFITPRSPELTRMILEGEIEAYDFPMAQICSLFEAIAANRPGAISKAGIGTFIDPRIDGGKLNNATTEDLVQLVNLAGEEVLFYKSFPIDIAIIRGSIADERGNISLEKEVARLDVLNMAIAAKNSGGIVIVEVGSIAQKDTLNPRMVEIPHILVDAVVLNEEQKQSSYKKYYPGMSGELRITPPKMKELDLGLDKVIVRRASLEIKKGQLINLGFRLPGEIPLILIEEGCIDEVTFSLEHGLIGGIPAFAFSNVFPAAINAQAMIDMSSQFLIYDGGGLDIAFLGMGQVGKNGDVNVSKFAKSIPGCGGFINITNLTKKIVICGSFTAGGLEVEVRDGKIIIIKEGKQKKFVNAVEHITLSGRQALLKQQDVKYITERAVFKLTSEGVILTEIAPGIDIEKNIRPYVEFDLKVDSNLKTINSRIFSEGRINLKEFL